MVALPDPAPAPPLHGYRGDADSDSTPARPLGLTVAVSREAGARGGSIARRVGQLLGWQVFDQDTLALLARDDSARRELLSDTPALAVAWATRQTTLRSVAPDSAALVNLVFTLAARGEVVLVGRGAGYLLPVASTLNVRVIAPHAERVAYLAQWLRLPLDEAAEELAARDRVRAALHAAVTGKAASDPTQYDLVLNSGRLGEAGCAELIVQALRAKGLEDGEEVESHDAV